MGSTLGATVLGAVLNHGLRASGRLEPITSDQLRQLLNTHSLIGGDAAIRVGLAQALNLTFWAMLVLSLVTVFLALLVPPTPNTDLSVKRVVEPD